MSTMSRSRRRAFTLLELLLVVLILGALAATTSSMVDSAHEQARFDATLARRDEIRRAIVGQDDPRTPVSGYVADVGAAPGSLDALVRPLGVPSFGLRDYEVGSGWRGPYVSATPKFSAPTTLEFADGWGNADLVANDPNFGWLFSLDPGSGDLTVISRGSDGLPGGVDYAADTTLLLRRDQYAVDLDDWTLDLSVALNPDASVASVTTMLAVRLWVPDGAGGLTSIEGLPRSANVERSPTSPLTFTFDPGPAERWVAQGVRAIELCNFDGSSVVALPNKQYALIELRARAPRPWSIARRLTVEVP